MGKTAWGFQFETGQEDRSEPLYIGLEDLKTWLGGWPFQRRTGEPLNVTEQGRDKIPSVLIPSFVHGLIYTKFTK